MSSNKFTKEELAKIKQAVQEAEARTNGEIVPVFAKQSGFYELALWRAGFTFGLVAAGGLIAIHYLSDILLWVPFYFWILAMLAFGFIGAWLTMSMDGLRRLFAGKDLLYEKAHQKAKVMFLEHGVFSTQQRIGIMIFISFFEHQVIVMADDGINEVVPQEQWNSVVKHIGDKLKAGDRAGAILGAIEECARILDESPIEIAPTENEIDDELRIEGE